LAYSILKRVEVWHNGAYIKRWKYWEYVLDIAADYMLEKCLLPKFQSINNRVVTN
jgi:hypothetical protein